MPKKVDVRNLVAHCTEGTSDKVYIASIRDNPNGTFTVIGKWGRNGKMNLMSMEQCTVDEWSDAAYEQRVLFSSKLSKGYEDINSDYYKGDVTYATPCIKNNLEEGLINLANDPRIVEQVLAKNKNYVVAVDKRTGKPVNVVKRKNIQEEDTSSNGGRRFDFDL